MAVLVEAISVVLRADAILAAYAGDWRRFAADVPNATLCADGELARVGFMVPDAARAFVRQLEQRGLRYLDGGAARDMVVADQQRGPMVPCDWVEFGHVMLDGNPRQRVAACRLRGSTLLRVICPDGWVFEHSLSSTYSFVPEGLGHRSLNFLRHKEGLSVYWNELSGEEVFVAEPDGTHT